MRPQTTNLQCVNSDSVGRYCIALNEIHKKCLDGECPFYKTDYQHKVGEAKAKSRCENLGIVFKTRSEIISEMNRIAHIQKERYEKEKERRNSKIIQFNSKENVYIEYDSLESVAKAFSVPIEIIEKIIKGKETYKGFRFVYA